MKHEPATTTQTAPAPWLYHPALDLIVGCGAWSLPLLLLDYGIGPGKPMAVLVGFYALALVFNYPHYMATLYRAYRTHEDVTKYKYFTLYFTGLIVLTAILTHWSYELLPWVFTTYVTWSPWHYTGQNYGLAMMFARRAGAQPSTWQRNLFYTAFHSSFFILFFTFHSGPSSDPVLVSLGFPIGFGYWARVILVGLFLVTSLWSVWLLVRQSSWKAMLAPIVLLSTQFLWFVAPTLLEFGSGISIAQTRYSSGVLAVMHSAQYLWITSYFARREAQAGATSPGWSFAAYFGTLIVGGIALFLPGPWLISYVFHYDFAASFLIFTAIVNIHHFMMDGVIWKLRDGRIAALLLTPSTGKAAGSSQYKVALFDAVRWMTGPTSGARVFRVATAIGLLFLAGLDLVKFYCTTNEQNLPNLVRAAELNPYDSVAQRRLAQAQLRQNNTDQTIVALQKAVKVNPHDPNTQHLLGKMLLERDRLTEAYAHYQQMVVHLPNDANALMNYAILEAQFGDTDKAIASWEQILQLDPSQVNAYRYLAENYKQQGNFQKAMFHAERFLESARKLPPDQVTPADVMMITLRMAQSEAQLNAQPAAITHFEAVIAQSRQLGNRDLEALALVQCGEAYGQLKQFDKALSVYQQGLQLERPNSSQADLAVDWFNYGQLLQSCQAPNRLILACFLKAETLLLNAGSEVQSSLNVVRRARIEVESRPDTDAAQTRRQVEVILQEALRFQWKNAK